MVYFTIVVAFPRRASNGQLLHQRPPWRPRTQTVRPLRLSRRQTPTFRGRSGTTNTRKASFLPVEVTYKVEIFDQEVRQFIAYDKSQFRHVAVYSDVLCSVTT
jgi:hypothetical protein